MVQAHVGCQSRAEKIQTEPRRSCEPLATSRSTHAPSMSLAVEVALPYRTAVDLWTQSLAAAQAERNLAAVVQNLLRLDFVGALAV